MFQMDALSPDNSTLGTRGTLDPSTESDILCPPRRRQTAMNTPHYPQGF